MFVGELVPQLPESSFDSFLRMRCVFVQISDEKVPESSGDGALVSVQEPGLGGTLVHERKLLSFARLPLDVTFLPFSSGNSRGGSGSLVEKEPQVLALQLSGFQLYGFLLRVSLAVYA